MLSIRSHFIELTNDKIDAFEVKIQKVLEDIFSFIVMVSFKEKENSLLRIDIDKERWANINKEAKLYVRLNKEHLILLKK